MNKLPIFTLVTSASSAAAGVFPECVGQNHILRGLDQASGEAKWTLMTDVSMFGLSGCFLDDCQKSDKWISVSYASCADACSKTPDCTDWTYGLEDGSKKCWLRKGQGGKEALAGYVYGDVTCRPQEFPSCVQSDVQYEGGILKGDVTHEGKYEGCDNDNCKETHSFPSPSHIDCSTVCANVDGCRFWSFGFDGEVSKCKLHTAEATAKPNSEGHSSGSVDCAPLSAWEAISAQITNPTVKKPVAPGNTACWGGGFTFDSCCHESHGPGGNVQCWDGNQYSHSNCCFAPENQEL